MPNVTNIIKEIILLSIIAFCLHLVWESLHVGLYTGYEHITNLPITVYATLGDVLYTIFAYLIMAIIKHDIQWLKNMSINDILIIATLGLFIAIFVEYKALLLFRWQYSSAMPIIPILNIGLSPVLQMTVLLPASLNIVKIIMKKMS
jgi:hypothetical protein